MAKSRTTPGSKNYKTYFLQGSGRADFNTIDGQILKIQVVSALGLKGLVETNNRQKADMIILLHADVQVTKTPMTYSTPNTVFIPGTTSISTTNTQYPGGLTLPSTTVTTTAGRTVSAGTTQHTIDRYGIVGGVTMRAYDWKEWRLSGAPAGTPMRVVWETEATFTGDPPPMNVNMMDKAYGWVLANAGEETSLMRAFSPPAQASQL